MLLFFQYNEYLMGMTILWIFFGSKNWTKLGGIYMHFRVFLKVKVQNGDILIFFSVGGGGFA